MSPTEVTFDMITLRFDRRLPCCEKIGNVNIYRVGFSTDNPDISDLSRFPLVFNKYLFPFVGFLRVRRLHQKNKYDLMWAMMANYAGFAALFFKYAHPRVPFLLTLQEGDPIEYIKHRVRFVYPLFVRIFKKADFVQAISTYLGNFAREMGYRGPLEVIPNGADVKNFQFPISNFQKEALRKKLGINENDKIIITTSRLVKKNAVGDIIEALAYLPENVKLLILGIGPLEQELKLQMTNYKLQKRVFFLGYVDHKNLPAYLHISDVFVRPSLSEGMGSSFIEAMMAGVPIVGTPIGGVLDFLVNEQTGLLCEIHNSSSIAKEVQRLLGDKELRERIISNGMELAEKKYNWDTIAESMKAIFKTL